MQRRAYTYSWQPPPDDPATAAASAYSSYSLSRYYRPTYRRLTEYTFTGRLYCETRQVLKDWLVGAVEQAEGLDSDETHLAGGGGSAGGRGAEEVDEGSPDGGDGGGGGGGGGGGSALAESGGGGGGMVASGGEEQQEGGWQLRQYERRHVSKFLNNIVDEAAGFPTVRVPEEGVRWAKRLEKGLDYPNLDLSWGAGGGVLAAGAAIFGGPVAAAVAGAATLAAAADFSVPYITFEARNDYCLVFRYRPHEGHDYPSLSLVAAPRVGGCAAVK
jgi:hypothetical protein